MNRRLESLSIDRMGCVADMKYAQTARVGLETIIRRLITLSTFLPTLPSTILSVFHGRTSAETMQINGTLESTCSTPRTVPLNMNRLVLPRREMKQSTTRKTTIGYGNHNLAEQWIAATMC